MLFLSTERLDNTWRSSSVAEQGTHKPLVGGSNPPSATTPMPLDELAAALDAGARALDIPDDAPIVLAVSGGPDSMALLCAAARLVETGARDWRLTVAHLDHGLRDDSADDAAFVTHAADELALPWELRRTDVAELATSEGRSIEDAGRVARYRFLEEVASEDALIATAHTADDAAETVLLNLLRGSGLGGVRGMPARRGRIVRPLLLQRRQTLRALLDGAGIGYRLDPSNDDPAYLRNRVRGELMPLLEELRHGAVDRIGQFARLAAGDDALLDHLAAVGAHEADRTEGRDRLARSACGGPRSSHDAPRDRRAGAERRTRGGAARGRGG